MAHIERLLKHLDVPQGPSDTTQLALALTIDAIDAEKPEPESVPLPLSVDLKAILKREPTLAESVCADPGSFARGAARHGRAHVHTAHT